MPGAVLVFAEQRGGVLKRSSLEALSEGRRTADRLGRLLVALIAGDGIGRLADQAVAFGPDRLLLIDSPLLAAYSTEGYAAALGQAITHASAEIVLLACTAMGRDLAPRVAARFGAGLATDCVALMTEGGVFRARRPVYSGKAYATVEFSGSLAMATLRPNVFPAQERPPAACEIVRLELELPESAIRARVVRTELAEKKEIDVADASIIVSGGRGLKDPANFSLIRELAEALGGAVGASRAVVDAGWIEHAHQVGQTGAHLQGGHLWHRRRPVRGDPEDDRGDPPAEGGVASTLPFPFSLFETSTRRARTNARSSFREGSGRFP